MGGFPPILKYYIMGFLDTITGLDVLKGGLSLINAFADRKAQKQMNEANIAMQRETNAMQQDMMREQNAFNERMAIDMFNRENEYNTPLKQVERMRAAGLNPAMMMDNGQMVNTGNISTPSAANVPSLTAPYMNKVQPVTQGVLDSLKSLSEMSLLNSQKKKTDSETWQNYKRTEQEILSMKQDIMYKQAVTDYQNLQTSLDRLFSPFERSSKVKEIQENIKYLSSMSVLNAMKGDTEKANQDYIKVEKLFKDEELRQLKDKYPSVLMMLRGQIALLAEQAKTEKSKQDLNYTSSQVNRGLSAIYQIQSELEGAKRDWFTNRRNNEYGFPTESNLEKIFNTQFRQALSNLSKTDKEAAKIDKEIDNLMLMARKNQKDLDWYEVERVWNMFIEFSEQNRKTAQTVISAVKPFSFNVDN